MEYILVAAPGGCGLKQAVEERLKPAIENLKDQKGGTFKVEHSDVEDTLCESYEARDLLRDVPVEGRPTMGDVTGYLPRTQVVELWRRALRQSLNSLSLRPSEVAGEKDTRASARQVNLLSCHLDLYGGRWRELYSPIDIHSLLEGGHKPSHVLLLIDDIYDMYRRLSRPRFLYDERAMIDSLGREREREVEEAKQEGLPDPPSLDLRTLEWRIEVLSSLISWRRAEMLTAEALARQVGARYLVFGVKHRTETVARWLAGTIPVTAYVSHPITRPRKMRRKTGRWPAGQRDNVVEQCNELPSALSESVICVMPTAIDELRIARDEKGLLPELGPRWPIQTAEGFSDTLYWLDVPATGGKWRVAGSDDDARHRSLLAPTGRRPNQEESIPSLRMLESLIKAEVGFRDHHLVVSAGCLLVFRPYYGTGKVSRGVAAEADHWSLLARAQESGVLGGMSGAADPIPRRAAFVHFANDIRRLLGELADQRDGHDVSLASSSVIWAMVRLLEAQGYSRSGMAQRLVQKLLADMSFASLLDAGVVPAHLQSRLREDWDGLLKQARIQVLGQQLTLAEMPEGRAGIWIVTRPTDLRRDSREVGQFLSGRVNAPQAWEELGLGLWMGQEGLI